MHRGICALCDEEGDLCDSHALPKSVFRFLFKRGSGKAVAVVDDQRTATAYSSDSWSDYLLCEACEGDLNDRFDSYGISVFRGRGCQIRRSAAGITFSQIDRQRLRMFVLSVLWRMAVSSSHAYENVRLPYELENELKLALREKRNVRPAVAEVGFCRLRDSSGAPALSMENLQRMLMAPFPRSANGVRSIGFLFFGFIIEVFFPRPPRKAMTGIGIASGSSPVLLAPFQEVATFPELIDLLVRALDKHEQGLSRVG